LAQDIASFLKNIEYIGPIRPEPQRVYVLDEIKRQQWRQQGWSAFVDFLEGRKLDNPVETRVDDWLEKLELGKHIAPPTRHFDADAMVSQIIIEEQGERPSVNLMNTGYGVSQVIPVIVQSLTARQRVREDKPRLVVIEQPELHLHPRAQARLTDIFIEAIYGKILERDDEGKITKRELTQVFFLLETHSEHLLLRLRRRVAESTIKKWDKETDPYLHIGDLAINFVDRLADFSLVQEVPINQFGDFVDIPDGFKGFFSDDRKEMLAIAQAKRGTH